jgi:hypothetical protein
VGNTTNIFVIVGLVPAIHEHHSFRYIPCSWMAGTNARPRRGGVRSSLRTNAMALSQQRPAKNNEPGAMAGLVTLLAVLA